MIDNIQISNFMNSPLEKDVHAHLYYTLFYECFGTNYLESDAYGNVHCIITVYSKTIHSFVQPVLLNTIHVCWTKCPATCWGHSGGRFYEMS